MGHHEAERLSLDCIRISLRQRPPDASAAEPDSDDLEAAKAAASHVLHYGLKISFLWTYRDVTVDAVAIISRSHIKKAQVKQYEYK